jgi:hypothetical protein
MGKGGDFKFQGGNEFKRKTLKIKKILRGSIFSQQFTLWLFTAA